MKMKLIAPLLLSLLATPAFAHPSHDEDEQMPVKKEVPQDPKASAPKAEHKHSHAPKPDKAAVEIPATPAAAEPKKTP